MVVLVVSVKIVVVVVVVAVVVLVLSVVPVLLSLPPLSNSIIAIFYSQKFCAKRVLLHDTPTHKQYPAHSAVVVVVGQTWKGNVYFLIVSSASESAFVCVCASASACGSPWMVVTSCHVMLCHVQMAMNRALFGAYYTQAGLQTTISSLLHRGQSTNAQNANANANANALCQCQCQCHRSPTIA